MQGLRWDLIALMATAIPLAALLISALVWRVGEMILGNIAGTIIIFGAALGMMFVEYSAIDRFTQGCIAAGSMCVPEPSAFARYSIYACLGLGEVFALFLWSLRVEKRIRNRDVAPEWR